MGGYKTFSTQIHELECCECGCEEKLLDICTEDEVVSEAVRNPEGEDCVNINDSVVDGEDLASSGCAGTEDKIADAAESRVGRIRKLRFSSDG